MNYLLILLIIIIIVLLSIKSNFTKIVKNTKKVYKTAYELGINYLKIMKYHNFYNLEYPAVMFDIDDTLIDHSGKPMKDIINLLDVCIDLGLIIIIITARSVSSEEYTIRELEKNKIRYNVLYLRHDNDDINTFKSKTKQYLAEKENMTIIMSVGDNLIDVDGNYSGYFIKLPNQTDSRLYHLNSDKKLEIVQ